MLAESCDLTLPQAHSALRAYAVRHGRGLVSIAHEIMHNTLLPDTVLAPAPPEHRERR